MIGVHVTSCWILASTCRHHLNGGFSNNKLRLMSSCIINYKEYLLLDYKVVTTYMKHATLAHLHSGGGNGGAGLPKPLHTAGCLHCSPTKHPPCFNSFCVVVWLIPACCAMDRGGYNSVTLEQINKSYIAHTTLGAMVYTVTH
jgi:hypothetical protein